MVPYRFLLGFFCLSIPFLSFANDCSQGVYIAISNQSSVTLTIPEGGDEGRQPDCGGNYPTLGPHSNFVGAFVNSGTRTLIQYSVMSQQALPPGACYNSARQPISTCPSSGQCYNLLGFLQNCPASGTPEEIATVRLSGSIGGNIAPRARCRALIGGQSSPVNCQVSTNPNDCPFVHQAYPQIPGACLIVTDAQ